jgi:hypothetical protein
MILFRRTGIELRQIEAKTVRKAQKNKMYTQRCASAGWLTASAESACSVEASYLPVI